MNAADWASPPLTRRRLGWALTALLVTALPFVNDIHLWIFVLLAATCAWRYIALLRKQTPPRPLFRFFWTLANFALVWASYGTISGLAPGTGLLLVMAAMKLTETGRSRDLIVIVYMSLFLIVAHALFDQSLPATLYTVAALVVTLTALIQISRRTEVAAPRPALRSAGMLCLQALPVVLILFVLFPRVPGPLWSLPNRGGATTGLSNSMAPGSISELLRSSAVAFRVQFDGEPPPAAQRYWRGPVFTEVNGRNWSPAPHSYEDVDLAVAGDAIGYTITLEPHFQRWLFALDAPAILPLHSRMYANLQILSDTAVSELRRYRVESHTDYRLSPSDPGPQSSRYLDVSRVDNPKTETLARQWRLENDSDAGVIRSALAHFNREPFRYTLKPPLLPPRGASDEFMFGTQSGFCEHYASSFTLLMRYAGIPARVVTGYQGGEVNAFSQHMTVRQSDAHAWSEVWLHGRGWVRIDPTAAVAPERVETGIGAALRDGETLAPLILGDGVWLSHLRHGWDAINAAWNDRVIGYGKFEQLGFLRKLGIDSPDVTKLVAFLSIGMVAFLLALAALLGWRTRPQQRDPLVRAFTRFCTKLARHGLVRAPGEGPLAYAQRAATALPAQAKEIAAIAALYVDERYGRTPSDDRRAALKKRVRSFSVFRA